MHRLLRNDRVHIMFFIIVTSFPKLVLIFPITHFTFSSFLLICKGTILFARIYMNNVNHRIISQFANVWVCFTRNNDIRSDNICNYNLLYNFRDHCFDSQERKRVKGRQKELRMIIHDLFTEA